MIAAALALALSRFAPPAWAGASGELDGGHPAVQGLPVAGSPAADPGGAPRAALARELADLAGGATRLAERARELAQTGDLRLAGHLAELAAQAAPDDKGVHALRAEVFGARAKQEASTMSKGIFSWAEQESTIKLA